MDGRTDGQIIPIKYLTILNNVLYQQLMKILEIYLENSTTAACNPKQIPKNGFPCKRHQLAANIFPSTPRFPNPPGTKIPLFKIFP